MNAKNLKDYLAAASACEPEASFAGPRELAVAVAEVAPAAEWEIAVNGADASVLRLALRFSERCDAALGAAAARVLGLNPAALAGEPAVSRLWFEAAWSTKTSRWLFVDIARRARRVETLKRLSPKPGRARPLTTKNFSAANFEEPVASALAAFDALAPIRNIQFVPGRPGWTLILAAPLGWPLFLRCDVAASFAPRAAQLSLLLRDARVMALEFDGDALWARLVG